MTSVRLDDQWADHPKFANLPDLAQLLWVKALTYACRYRTKGFVPFGQVGKLTSVRSTKSLEAKLVSAGLWIQVLGGYRIHDFEQYQGVSEKTSAALSAAGRAGADKRWGRDGQANGQGHDDGDGLAHDADMAEATPSEWPTDGPVSRDARTHAPAYARAGALSPLVLSGSALEDPDPENTDPASQRAEGRQRARKPESAIPDVLEPNEKALELAGELGFDAARVAREMGKFRDDALKHDKRWRDWQAAIRSWFRKAVEFERSNSRPGPARAVQPAPTQLFKPDEEVR